MLQPLALGSVLSKGSNNDTAVASWLLTVLCLLCCLSPCWPTPVPCTNPVPCTDAVYRAEGPQLLGQALVQLVTVLLRRQETAAVEAGEPHPTHGFTLPEPA